MIKIETSRQIGATVRRERARQGLTQQQLAEAAGVSRALISRLEKGTATALYPEKLLAILNALGLSLFMSDPSQENAPGSKASLAASRSSIVADAARVMSKVGEHTKLAAELAEATRIGLPSETVLTALGLQHDADANAAIRAAAQSSMANIAEQLASATANADFLNTSPLLAPREQSSESGDRK